MKTIDVYVVTDFAVGYVVGVYTDYEEAFKVADAYCVIEKFTVSIPPQVQADY